MDVYVAVNSHFVHLGIPPGERNIREQNELQVQNQNSQNDWAISKLSFQGRQVLAKGGDLSSSSIP